MQNICAAERGPATGVGKLQILGHPNPPSPARAQLARDNYRMYSFRGQGLFSTPQFVFVSLFGGLCGTFCFQEAPQYTHTECFPDKMLEMGLVFNSL